MTNIEAQEYLKAITIRRARTVNSCGEWYTQYCRDLDAFICVSFAGVWPCVEIDKEEYEWEVVET